MKKLISFLTVIAFASILLSSCKNDYQRMSTEFIRSLPDSCEFLIAVDNEAEHLVYYTPDCVPIAMGAGIDHILVAYSDIDNISSASFYSVAQVQMYNLKTQTFNKLLECDGCVVDKGKKQITCYSFETDRYGDGNRIDEVYDYDGKLLSKKRWK